MAASDHRHNSRNYFRRVIALPRAQSRIDGERVDPGGRTFNHHLSPCVEVFAVARRGILQNNIVQTAVSAGESIAFGLGVTMPAIMILGFDLEITRVILVAVLGGLLGILMMIPLRRAFSWDAIFCS